MANHSKSKQTKGRSAFGAFLEGIRGGLFNRWGSREYDVMAVSYWQQVETFLLVGYINYNKGKCMRTLPSWLPNSILNEVFFIHFFHKIFLSHQRFSLSHFPETTSLPKGNNYSDFHCHRLILLVLELHINGILQYVFYCYWTFDFIKTAKQFSKVAETNLYSHEKCMSVLIPPHHQPTFVIVRF